MKRATLRFLTIFGFVIATIIGGLIGIEVHQSYLDKKLAEL